MSEIVAVDIGGTHARFAIAALEGGRVRGLSDEVVLRTADHPSLTAAWRRFESDIGRALPRAAGIAVAGPVDGDVVALTNNLWMIRPATLGEELGVDDFVLVNDFGAVAHAVAHLEPGDFQRLCGPDTPLPPVGVISVVGPGTGLGVALLIRTGAGGRVVETEGGHVDFAPRDDLEDKILARLRRQYRRVSVERLVSGPGLVNIYAALADIEGRPARTLEDRALWRLALEGEDPLAVAALDRFCMMLGAFAGDMALAHGAHGVAVAGGLGLRMGDRLATTGFAQRFCAKGRFERRMADLPVRLIRRPEPGLMGAAAAFADRRGA